MKKSLILSIVGLAACCSAFSARAFDLGLGLAAVEQGDDQQRPAALMHVGWTNAYISQIYYYGRDFGPVSERTYLASFMRRFNVFKTLRVEAAVGLNVLLEAITLEEQISGESTPKKENDYNFGASFGLYYAPNLGPLLLQMGWESHVYPAGANGGLFMATARKHFVSLSCGVRL